MTDERPAPEEPMSDAAPSELATRGTALSTALGFETLIDRACAMRVAFRPDLVGDPAVGGLAGGVVFALLDQTCGMAIGIALRGRWGGKAVTMTMGGDGDAGLPARPHPPAAGSGAAVTAEAECVRIAGDVAVVRGWAYDDDPADPIAAAQAAFMIMSCPTAAK